MDTLARQMIVLSVTSTEGMVGEFVECVFFKHPNRMHQFLEIGGVKGVLSLKHVISSKSVTDLQVELSRIGSRKVLQGKFSSLFDKVENISGQDIPNDLKNRLIETVKLRNEIVHEVKYPSVTSENVASAYDDMYQLLVCLCHATKKNSVPLNDPGGLLN